ncbi:tRNA (guanosine(37)-N1)-methyltransferase TrmD [Gardnerella vaginalis]|uniref:tRNA (guanine-N(1)-)-methyltransferase n=1 Tax=Gardnerella vaginalis TaxID=2702 RepID=A0ABD4ZGH6_GARVA|nr:tRNA (guanosine(37)-N1)-methyltransferase TrmD [Gardnerella vaginalis]MDK6862002.1 tRNA (guanosine(37)-N1)-methyltransferase TrmD [Gardnerella vaginalis]
MQIDIISVFPEYFRMLDLSLLGKAQDNGLLKINAYNLRKWTHDVHQSVDDTPVGGGAGMVMKPEVWAECLDELLYNGDDADNDDNKADIGDNGTVLIFPNPSAPLFSQKDATQLASAKRLVFVCGRYEGYDARIPEYYKSRGVDVREYSIGDYVLNGGEVAVSVMVEAITRLIPGFMGNPESIVEESYTGADAILEHHQYTRPTTWRGISVPAILTSGDHAKVDRFRRDDALERTSQIRPDLIEKLDCKSLSKQDRKTLISLGWEVSGDSPKRL